MNRKPLAETISLVAKAAAPATAVATSLVAPLAQAGPGDLDPSFADHGRLGPIEELIGSAYSVEALDDGGMILGGGFESACFGWYCYYDFNIEASNFVSSVSESGGLDASYYAQPEGNIEVTGIARQPDGKVVAAGRRVSERSASVNHLVVFRLRTDGSLDGTFGTRGLVELDADVTVDDRASAVSLDPDGKIVVAGVRAGALTVLRLDSTGAIDESFGQAGFFTGPDYNYGAGARLVRLSSGDYRVTTSDNGSCRVLGLTAAGALDSSYGGAGYALVASGVGDAACLAIAARNDGRLLVAGFAAGQAFVARLRANGILDPGFSAPDLAALSEATALAVAADGKILLGGDGVGGATVMRLQATGELDTLFGHGGSTTVDLPSYYGGSALINDIAIRSDGGILAAGGASWPARAFAVRLLGDGGGASAGILSVVQEEVAAKESDGKAVIHVRRTGGRDGEVSARYQTVHDNNATEGADYTAATGRLHWADGDDSEREIEIPIAQDDGVPEGYESFGVQIDHAEGGAGFGTQYAPVTIRPDGDPGGQIEISSDSNWAYEGSSASLWVSRNYYSEGEVSVTVTVEAGSATSGDDFSSDPVTVTWRANDGDAKQVLIPITDDSLQEDTETFRVVLSNATGGAILGASASSEISIPANDAPRAQPSHGGGGAAGILSVLLLGLAECFRAGRRRLKGRR